MRPEVLHACTSLRISICTAEYVCSTVDNTQPARAYTCLAFQVRVVRNSPQQCGGVAVKATRHTPTYREYPCSWVGSETSIPAALTMSLASRSAPLISRNVLTLPRVMPFPRAAIAHASSRARWVVATDIFCQVAPCRQDHRLRRRFELTFLSSGVELSGDYMYIAYVCTMQNTENKTDNRSVEIATSATDEDKFSFLFGRSAGPRPPCWRTGLFFGIFLRFFLYARHSAGGKEQKLLRAIRFEAVSDLGGGGGFPGPGPTRPGSRPPLTPHAPKHMNIFRK